ncbi:MAG TPA: hypothetical protein VF286_08195 [Acidiphilium sp.]
MAQESERNFIRFIVISSRVETEDDIAAYRVPERNRLKGNVPASARRRVAGALPALPQAGNSIDSVL